eukprot:m.31941 g.31941  ORF g.31941 m.31941 type:complete len:54 (-) comp5431_c0_seq1:80-241(-)
MSSSPYEPDLQQGCLPLEAAAAPFFLHTVAAPIFFARCAAALLFSCRFALSPS